MAYNRAAGQATRDDQRKYYLPRIDLKNIMLLLMEEIFMIIRSKVILKNKEN